MRTVGILLVLISRYLVIIASFARSGFREGLTDSETTLLPDHHHHLVLPTNRQLPLDEHDHGLADTSSGLLTPSKSLIIMI